MKELRIRESRTRESRTQKSKTRESKTLSIRILSIVLIFSGNLAYGGIIEANKYGTIINSFDAYALSMGNSWLTFSGSSVIDSKEGIKIQYSPNISLPTESRSQFIFDQYDNTVGKQITGYSSNLFLDFPFTAHLCYTRKPLYFSIGTEPVIQAHWRFEDIERDDFYQITKRETREKSILINGATLRAGWKSNKFQTGIIAKWLYGGFYEYWQSLDEIDSTYHTGSGYEIGGRFSYQINWRLTAILKGSLGQRFSTPVNDYEYPYRVGAGVVFRPANRLPAVATIEIVYTPWEKLKINNLIGEDVDNTISISGGIEHRLQPGLWMRLGYSWNQSPLNKEIILSSYTGGIGYENWGFKFDLGASFSSNSFTYDEFQLANIGEGEIVEETETRIILSITKEL